MKAVLLYTFLAGVTALFTSCKKFDETSLEGEQRANQFQEFVQDKRFQVAAFYADQPIDYIEYDAEVRSETDLFRYASPWIKDDWNVFDRSSGQVTITQNAVEINDIPDDSFVRPYTIGADKDGVYFNFLDYEYDPLSYRLVEFRDNYFIVYVNWKGGVRLYTRFEAR
jgi:hypothetical protein